MRRNCSFLVLFLLFFVHFPSTSWAQTTKDSVMASSVSIKDTANKVAATDSAKPKKKYIPRIATIRSAVIPGWGQIYNKKYWKVPIIYGALGTTTGIFFYNLKTYKQLRQAVILLSDTIPSNDTLVDPRFRILGVNSLRTYRDEFRQNIDYSVLAFLIFWGLNIVDATVDAHLKSFDISPDISMKVRPSLNPMNNGPGLSFIFSLKDKPDRALLPLP
jgi:Family of unknown function (DUF5683)